MAGSDKDVRIRVGADVAGAIAGFDRVSKSIVKLGTRAGDIGRSVDRVFAPMMRGLTRVVMGVTAAAAGATAAVLKIGGNFEHQMTKVSSVASATTEEFAQLELKARALGETLPITASEAADAMYQLASAGMKVNEIMGAVEAVTGLSIAQDYGLADTAALMVSVLRSFGMQAEDSMRIADAFNNAISTSMLNMPKLADAIKYVAPIAAKTGVSFEAMVAAMGKLSDAGIAGEQIGTGLRQILLSLIDPSDKTQRTLDKLGVSVKDASGKMRELDDIFKDLKASGMDATDAFRMFDTRGTTIALILAEAADELENYEKQVGKAGRTQEILNRMLETFPNKVKAVRSAAEETAIIGFRQGLEKYAKGVADSITEIIRAFNDWAKQTGVIGKSIAAFFEGLGFAKAGVDNFKKALYSLDADIVVGKFKAVGEGVRKFTDALWELSKNIDWDFLAEHLGTIARIIVYGWAAGKILLVVDAISQFYLAIRKTALFLNANPMAAAFLATAGAIALVIMRTQEMEQAQKEAMEAQQEAEKMEKYAEDYSEALKGNEEALARLPEKYQKMVAAKKDNTKATKDMEETARVLAEREKSLIKPTGAFDDKIKALTESLKSGKISLAEYNEEMNKLADAVRKTMNEPVVEPRGTIEDEFGKAIDETNKKIRDMQANARVAMEEFGMGSKEAGAILKAKITEEIGTVAEKLEKDFGPSVAKAFIQTLGNSARKGGDQLVAAITDAILKAKTAMASFEEQLNKLKSGVKLSLGEGYETKVISEDMNKAIVQVTNGMATFYQTIDKMTGKSEGALSGMLGLDQLDSQMTILGNKLEASLNALGPSGKMSGDAVGKGLHDGITGWVEQAVKSAQEKINSLKAPTFSGTGGGNLAAAVNQAGRGL